LSRFEAWLAAREPVPPPGLVARLRASDEPPGPLAQRLARAALARLDLALARPGRVRESAFRLLEADALLTYACEAALESADPESVLLDILAATGR
jgi:hypothetical protein